MQFSILALTFVLSAAATSNTPASNQVAKLGEACVRGSIPKCDKNLKCKVGIKYLIGEKKGVCVVKYAGKGQECGDGEDDPKCRPGLTCDFTYKSKGPEMACREPHWTD